MKRSLVITALAAAALPAAAQTPPPPKPQPQEQVVVPEVDRRPIKKPRLPSNDFSIGLFYGTYATENFGTSAVSGIKLGYAITEDIFVEGAYGKTTVSDEAFRQIFPGGGVLSEPQQKLNYYNLSAGWNVLTGEAFFGRRTAKALQSYVVAGIGSTDFAGQRKQTLHVGMGLRVLFNDRFSVQFDARDHLFPLDILGRKQNTHNLEFTTGLTVYF
jgi:outer membrane beta-barrel protein